MKPARTLRASLASLHGHARPVPTRVASRPSTSASVALPRKLGNCHVSPVGNAGPTRRMASHAYAPVTHAPPEEPAETDIALQPSNLDTLTTTISVDRLRRILSSGLTDRASIIDLIPAIEQFVLQTDLGEGVEVISLVLRKMGEHNMLAILPLMLDLFSRRLSSALKQDAIDPGELEGAYRPILLALGSFHRQSTLPFEAGDKSEKTLNRPAQGHILRLVRSLVQHLDDLPTSSTATAPRISDDMLAMLFETPFLHPELMRFLLDYTRTRRITCTSWIWWRCHLLAVSERDDKAARRYSSMATRAAKLEGKGRAKGGDEQVQVGNRGKDIAAMVNARTARTVDQYLRLAQDRLFTADDDVADHAWSHLLQASRHDHSIDRSTLASLRDSLPKDRISGYAYTPLMLGLLELGAVAEAWQAWLDLVDLDRDSSPTDAESKYVDRTALAVGTYTCHAHLGLDAAIRLVDAWATRVRPDARDNGKGKERDRGIKLDAHNLNILLTLCRRDKRPSIALRLFAAASHRWGIYADDISLTLLLDTCRYASASDLDNGDGGRHDMRDRLRLLADELRFSRRRPMHQDSSQRHYKDDEQRDYAQGSVDTTLLDPAGHTWRREHSAAPWSVARDMFREIMLANWPHLADVASPLDFERGPYAHQTRDLASFFRFSSSTSTAGTSSPARPPARPDMVHLVPSANTFHSFIALLGYYNLPHEIPEALAWMRRLDIRPHRRTMLLALTHLGEVEGPRRLLVDWEEGQSRLVRDTEVLRRWLTDWFAETNSSKRAGKAKGKGVPSEEDVAVYRRALVQANKRLTA